MIITVSALISFTILNMGVGKVEAVADQKRASDRLKTIFYIHVVLKVIFKNIIHQI